MNNKQFDSTICFTFFGSWVNAIEELETEADANSDAYTLFKAIANYSMYDCEPEFDNKPYLRAIWAMIEREIDRSVNRRKSGFTQDERHQKVRAYIEEHPSATVRQISDDTGISRSAVGRIIQKIDDTGSDTGSDTGIVTGSDTGIVTGIVSMGRDSGTPQSLSNKEDYFDEDSPIIYTDGRTPTPEEIAEAWRQIEQQEIDETEHI